MREGGEGDSKTNFSGRLTIWKIHKNLSQSHIWKYWNLPFIRGWQNFTWNTFFHKRYNCISQYLLYYISHYGIDLSPCMLEHGTSQWPVYPLWKIRRPIHQTKCKWDFITSKRLCNISILLWIPKSLSWKKIKNRERDWRKYGGKKTWRVDFICSTLIFICMHVLSL